MFKLTQKGYGNKLENELKFESKTSRYDRKNTANINILSRHHKRLVDWNGKYRNKYACDRWINDTRGCGFGCIVSKKRFTY